MKNCLHKSSTKEISHFASQAATSQTLPAIQNYRWANILPGSSHPNQTVYVSDQNCSQPCMHGSIKRAHALTHFSLLYQDTNCFKIHSFLPLLRPGPLYLKTQLFRQVFKHLKLSTQKQLKFAIDIFNGSTTHFFILYYIITVSLYHWLRASTSIHANLCIHCILQKIIIIIICITLYCQCICRVCVHVGIPTELYPATLRKSLPMWLHHFNLDGSEIIFVFFFLLIVQPVHTKLVVTTANTTKSKTIIRPDSTVCMLVMLGHIVFFQLYNNIIFFVVCGLSRVTVVTRPCPVLHLVPDVTRSTESVSDVTQFDCIYLCSCNFLNSQSQSVVGVASS